MSMVFDNNMSEAVENMQKEKSSVSGLCIESFPCDNGFTTTDFDDASIFGYLGECIVFYLLSMVYA